jgi:hypothetical protein
MTIYKWSSVKYTLSILGAAAFIFGTSAAGAQGFNQRSLDYYYDQQDRLQRQMERMQDQTQHNMERMQDEAERQSYQSQRQFFPQ